MVICYKGKNRTFGKVINETVSLPNALEKPYFPYVSPLRMVNPTLHITCRKSGMQGIFGRKPRATSLGL
jgi:hypothetical protein